MSYCLYNLIQSGPSLLLESTNSMIKSRIKSIWMGNKKAHIQCTGVVGVTHMAASVFTDFVQKKYKDNN